MVVDESDCVVCLLFFGELVYFLPDDLKVAVEDYEYFVRRLALLIHELAQLSCFNLKLQD